MSRMSGKKASNSFLRSSTDMFSTPVADLYRVPEAHPFGVELAQVSELAEEYMATGVSTGAISEEEQFLLSRGLFKYDAQDYMAEIQDLYSSAFEPMPMPLRTMWI